jgi:hypothetical protein
LPALQTTPLVFSLLLTRVGEIGALRRAYARVVMPALVAGIHVSTDEREQGVDGRDKARP